MMIYRYIYHYSQVIGFYLRDTATTVTLRPVTPPCFECTTQTAEHPANLCGDYVVTFKYACTDDPCYTTNPCCTQKFGCKKIKSKTNKSCCIEHMEAAYRKSQLRMLKKNKKNKIINNYGFI